MAYVYVYVNVYVYVYVYVYTYTYALIAYGFSQGKVLFVQHPCDNQVRCLCCCVGRPAERHTQVGGRNLLGGVRGVSEGFLHISTVDFWISEASIASYSVAIPIVGRWCLLLALSSAGASCQDERGDGKTPGGVFELSNPWTWTDSMTIVWDIYIYT